MTEGHALKPCPFCGGEAGTLLDTRTDEWKVWCLRPTQACGTIMIGDSRGEVERKWNRRANPEREAARAAIAKAEGEGQ